MLVLDEQLLGRNLEAALRRWYRGPVRFITDLRQGTVIKDDNEDPTPYLSSAGTV